MIDEEETKMTTYVELMAQIEALQKQAEALRQSEIAGVIEEIKQKMRDYDLTPADLGFAAPSAARSEAAAGRPSKRAPVKPKYQDPVSGKTWTGRGVMPKWLKEAIDAGHERDAFLIPER